MKAWDEKIEAMTAGIKFVLDYIGFEPSEGTDWLPGDPPAQSIMDWCCVARLDFKEFKRSTAHGAVVHALA